MTSFLGKIPQAFWEKKCFFKKNKIVDFLQEKEQIENGFRALQINSLHSTGKNGFGNKRDFLGNKEGFLEKIIFLREKYFFLCEKKWSFGEKNIFWKK